MSLEARLLAVINAIGADVKALNASSGGGSVFSAMQLSNTDTTTNMNQNSLTLIPIGGTATSFGSDFTQVGNTIQANFDGTVRISASVYQLGAGQRNAIAVEYFKNGSTLGPRFNTSYIRLGSGHNEASCACPAFLSACSDGDIFDIRSVREASSGNVTMNGAGRSYMLLERVE